MRKNYANKHHIRIASAVFTVSKSERIRRLGHVVRKRDDAPAIRCLNRWSKKQSNRVTGGKTKMKKSSLEIQCIRLEEVRVQQRRLQGIIVLFVPKQGFLRVVFLHNFHLKKTSAESQHILVEVYDAHAITWKTKNAQAAKNA